MRRFLSITLSLLALTGWVIPRSAYALDFQSGPSYLWGGATSVAADYSKIVVGYTAGLRLYDSSSAAGFPVLGQLEFADGVLDMTLQGAQLYLTSRSQELHRVDLSQPATPIHVAQVDPVHNHRLVEHANGWMVTGAGARLHLYDLSDPAAPVLVDSCECVDSPELMVLSDSLIVVMDANLDLHAVAISGGSLTDVLSVDSVSVTSHLPPSIAMYRSHLYVPQRDSGVVIIDYSDPTAPTTVDPFITYGSAEDVCVHGDRLTIADRSLGLITCRLYDPAHPFWQDELPEIGPMFQVWPGMSGRFFATQGTELVAVDASYLGQLNVVGRFSYPGQYRHLVRSGELALISDVFGLWRAIPDSVDADTLFTRAGLYGIVSDMVTVEGLLYTAEGSVGGGIYHVSDVGNLTRLAALDVDRNATEVAVSDTRAVVIQDNYGFEVFDVSDPSAPDHLGRYRRERFYLDAVMPSDRYLYLSENSGGVTVYDLIQPIKPKKLGTLFDPVSPGDMLIYDGYLYVASSPGGLHVYSIANPAAPSLVAYRPISGGAQTLWRSGRTVYAGGQTGRVRAYDIDDPTNPVQIGAIDLPYSVKDIVKYGERLWFTSESFIGTLDVLPPLLPGDTDNNGVLDPLDLITLIDHIFMNGKPLIRPNTADVNGDGSVNLVDVVRMVGVVYLNGESLLPGTIE